MEKVRADKLREVTAGHDGTWVAHPGLVPLARSIFDEHMKTPNQISNLRQDVHVKAADLLTVPEGPITEAGLRTNVEVSLLYLESWLRGTGCVPIHNLMEDAATAEISRAQIWQWVRNSSKLEDGTVVTAELVRAAIDTEMDKLREQAGDTFATRPFDRAREIFESVLVFRINRKIVCGQESL